MRKEHKKNRTNSGNIILIGMPASGKSTAGVVLAKILGYDFIDTDLLLQREGGCRLDQMIREKGMEAFLTAENELCSRLEADHTVIATGGSVVYGEEAMKHLCGLGKVVYLEVSPEKLRERLPDLCRRGVIVRPGQSLEDLYRERVPLYRRYADFTIREDGLSLEETAEAVCSCLEKEGAGYGPAPEN